MGKLRTPSSATWVQPLAGKQTSGRCKLARSALFLPGFQRKANREQEIVLPSVRFTGELTLHAAASPWSNRRTARISLSILSLRKLGACSGHRTLQRMPLTRLCSCRRYQLAVPISTSNSQQRAAATYQAENCRGSRIGCSCIFGDTPATTKDERHASGDREAFQFAKEQADHERRLQGTDSAARLVYADKTVADPNQAAFDMRWSSEKHRRFCSDVGDDAHQALDDWGFYRCRPGDRNKDERDGESKMMKPRFSACPPDQQKRQRYDYCGVSPGEQSPFRVRNFKKP